MYGLIVMASTMTALIVTAYIGMAHIVVACIFMAYIFMAGRPVPLPTGRKTIPRGRPTPLPDGRRTKPRRACLYSYGLHSRGLYSLWPR